MRDVPVRERAAGIRDRMERAARRSGRDPGSVRLVAASKAQPTERILEAWEAGITAFGENYVQEAAPKVAALPGAEWHLIGRLQRNKAGRAVALFAWIQTIDSAELLREVARRAAGSGRTLPVLIEVNLGDEASKAGAGPESVPGILATAADLPAVRVRGLMAIPPFSEDPERTRPHFARLKALLDSARAVAGPGSELTELSMGMSHDFEAAIEEGATMVRVGTALFGSRGGRGR